METLGAVLVFAHVCVAFLFSTVIPALIRERYTFQVGIVFGVIFISLTSSIWIWRFLQAVGA
jgi:hypothetical protein